MFKKTSKMIALLISSTVLLTFSLTGCGSQPTQNASQSSSKEEIVFANWAIAEESTSSYIKKVIDEFQKQNPNITVKSVPISVTDMASQLTTMVMGGNAPDIAQILTYDGVTLASMGALQETDNLVPKELASDPFYKTSWNLGMYNDKHYGLPWVPQPLGFWYNKTLMKQAGLDPNKPPKTWDEFNQYMDQARKSLPSEIVIIGMDTTVRTIALEQEWPYIRSFGAIPIQGNNVQANSEQMANYATWVRKMAKEGYTLSGKKYGEFRAIGAQHHLLFTLDVPQFKGVIQSLDKNLTDDKFYQEWGLTSLPKGVDGKSYAAPDDHQLLIFKASKHQAAAYKFAEFLATSETSFKEYIKPVGLLPATESGFKKYPDLFGDETRKAYLTEVLPNVVPLPVGPNLPKTATVIMTGVQQMISTNQPISTITNDMQVKLEGIINGK